MFRLEQRTRRRPEAVRTAARTALAPIASPVSSRKACPCGGCCPGCAKARQTAHEPARAAAHAHAPAIVRDVVNTPGRSMEPAVQRSMEERLGSDFRGVRVHDDQRAAMSARAMNAAAYAVGNHIVFGSGRYDPATREGGNLLAHELTHVAQQGAATEIPPQIPMDDRQSAAESEAARASAHHTGGPIAHTTPVSVARFSDTGHHIVEEAALASAGFSESEIKGVERGNVHRDYSQVGTIGNFALLCQPSDFGGYKPEEHFDNFIWDDVNGWRTRGGSAFQEKGVDIQKTPTPIDYIGSQLEEVANRGLTKDGKHLAEDALLHLGNAFHTVEDFFAHSNFVEMMMDDRKQISTLMTGNPVGPSQSVSRIFEAITPPGMREHYREESEEAIRRAVPGTHTLMAHDDPAAPNYTIARRMAALVIQELAVDVRAVMAEPALLRARAMKDRVMSKIVRYLRPPDPKDKWWETLVTRDAGEIDKRLDEAAKITPITVNQCMASPLKNMEASKDSSMVMPIGIALPTVIRGNQVWFQAGAGTLRPMTLDSDVAGSNATSQSSLVAGAQITGRF